MNEYGEVSERSKVPDSKSGVVQATGGSNPPLSANALTQHQLRQPPTPHAPPTRNFRNLCNNALNSSDFLQLWRGDREAEGARLELVCSASYRGFESPPLRQHPARLRTRVNVANDFSLRFGIRNAEGWNKRRGLLAFLSVPGDVTLVNPARP